MAEEANRRQRGMTPLKITLGAGIPKRFEVAGDYFHVKDSPVNDLVARFDDGEPVPVQQGIGFRRYYDSVELSSATGQAVVCYVGFGSVADGRSTANVSTTVNISPGNTFDDGADVTVPATNQAPIVAADPDRLYVIIASPSSAAGPVRIGSSGVGTNNGALLEPGVSLPIATTAELFCYNNNGSAVTLSIASVKEA